ncbi:FAD-dependent oxidoreductase [Promicromonospora vindobonensis]|uniref:FAD-dependent oxidoreductase n=1 Tax=Promicromonospora vindobonensis TaxID=195748 RepID=A0ABW5VSH3_9MICO
MTTAQNLPVVVIGAGPVGLAAAAHLAERGLEPLVIEAGDGAGAAVAQWGHVRLFSPWRYDVDAAARRLLTAAGAGRAEPWTEPEPDALPTGAELVERYLAPLADALVTGAGAQVRYRTRVLAVTKDGADRSRSLGRERLPYLVRLTTGPADGSAGAGTVEEIRAQAVIDASGTYDQPNPLGTSGLPTLGEPESARFLAGALPDVLGRDRERFAGRHTLVVGMGHSAANTLLSLVELAEQEAAQGTEGTRITWAIRGGSPRRLYGGGTGDDLPARGLLGTRLRDAVEAGRIELLTRVAIDRLEPATDPSTDPANDTVRVLGSARRDGDDGALDLSVHQIAAATGFRPDLAMLREVRLDLDPVVEAPRQIAPLIDPNFHSCGTVPAHGEAELTHPDAGFYLVGMKSYGRAPTFLLATGYEQVRSIAAALAGDRAAADAVELNLPETGVCSSDLALAADADGKVSPDELAAYGSSSCCSVPAGPQQVSIGAAPSGATPLGEALVDTTPVTPVGFSTGVVHGRSGD